MVRDHEVIPLTLMMVVLYEMGSVSLAIPFFLALNLRLRLILQGKVRAPMPFISWPLLIYAGLSLRERALSKYIKNESAAPFVDSKKTPESRTSVDYY